MQMRIVKSKEISYMTARGLTATLWSNGDMNKVVEHLIPQALTQHCALMCAQCLFLEYLETRQ